MCSPDVIQIDRIWRAYISNRIFRRRTHLDCPHAQRAWREDSTQQRAVASERAAKCTCVVTARQSINTSEQKRVNPQPVK
jgi:hypothetical protein